MIEENFNDFKEVIETELEKIEMNEAYINNKTYIGLDRELLSYIRELENLNEARLNAIDYIKEIAGICNKYGVIKAMYAQNELNTEAVDNALNILEGDD